MKRLVALLMTFMLLFQKASAETVHLEKKICPGRQDTLMDSILHKEMKSRKRNRPNRPGTDVT